ncbi:MAG: hypothetical protein K0Q49_1620 [Haloplasmataceae bacterium]|jgi:hypothetical protein|nr:hypothetical protein [Haloplasmataceae bacterium]
MYKALLVTEENGLYKREIVMKEINDLPNGDVLIHVLYSSVNYNIRYQLLVTRELLKIIPILQELMLQELWWKVKMNR